MTSSDAIDSVAYLRLPFAAVARPYPTASRFSSSLKKRRRRHAPPEAFALVGERLDGVEVRFERKRLAEGRREPMGQRFRRALHQRDDRLAVEGAVGFGVVRMRAVAGKAEQQRRHAEGERDLARGGGLRLDEVHVLRRERERLPVEAAFEQQRTAGIAGALVVRLELALQPVELRVGEASRRRRRARRRAARRCRAAPCSRRRPRCGCRARSPPLPSARGRNDRPPDGTASDAGSAAARRPRGSRSARSACRPHIRRPRASRRHPGTTRMRSGRSAWSSCGAPSRLTAST